MAEQSMNDKKIFIQIASYRDPQLLPTINDCLFKAKNPENLNFGIAWQHSKNDEWDILDIYKEDSRFKIIDIDYKDSRGACWARNGLQQLYSGEDFTLQLDSHHRFVQNWDEILIEMLKGLQTKGYKKPLITSYIPSFDPDNDPDKRVYKTWKMVFDRFIPEGAVFFKPQTFDANEPLLARFYSAHFCFTLGKFCKEVQHDPGYYFHGEEISIAARAFTHGYDLFHPHKIIAWHEYTRKNRTKQWDDDKNWLEKNEICHKRNRILFGMDGEDPNSIDFDKYGFGNIRTLKDYEKYAGIKFSSRSITQDALIDNTPSLNNLLLSDKDFDTQLLSTFDYTIEIDFDRLPDNDYDFWVVAFRDENRKDMYRQDVSEDDILRMRNTSTKYKIYRNFDTIKRPSDWMVWPHSKSKGWMDQIVGHLGIV